MEQEAQLKLQAYLDGELLEVEARAVADRLAGDTEAADLLNELRQTRQAFAGFEDEIRLPESREFYWSKIRREIERQDVAAPEPSAPVPFLARLRYLLVPISGVALVAFIAYLAIPYGNPSPGIETALADSKAFTYHDFSAGTTLVWLSYPAENEPAEITDDFGALE